jgi:hypothetical protein
MSLTIIISAIILALLCVFIDYILAYHVNNIYTSIFIIITSSLGVGLLMFLLNFGVSGTLLYFAVALFSIPFANYIINNYKNNKK